MTTENLKHLSISQLNKFDECPRKHHYQYVQKVETPSSDAQDYGKQCHSYLEGYLKGELVEFPKDWHGKTCKAALENLPKPHSGDVERYFEIKLDKLSVPLIGYMDYCSFDQASNTAILLDHKIVKDDKYLLTSEKLAQTNQIIVYSYFLLDLYKASSVDASYLYIKRGGGWSKKITTHLDSGYVEKSFSNIADRLEKLEQNYSLKEEDATQILSACEKWGGCPFKDKCWGKNASTYQNNTQTIQNTQTTNKGTLDMSNLFARLSLNAAKTNADQATTQTTTQASTQANAQVVVNQNDFNKVSASNPIFATIANVGNSQQKQVEKVVAIDENQDVDDTNDEDGEEQENVFKTAIDADIEQVHVLFANNGGATWESKDDSFEINSPEYATIDVDSYQKDVTASKSQKQEGADLDLFSFAAEKEATIDEKVVNVDLVNDIKNDIFSAYPEVDETQDTQDAQNTQQEQEVIVIVDQKEIIEVVDTHPQEIEQDSEKLKNFLLKPIDALGFNNRTRNCFENQNFKNVLEALKVYGSFEQFVGMKGFGQGCISNLESVLESHGISKDIKVDVSTIELPNETTIQEVAIEQASETTTIDVATEQASEIVAQEVVVEQASEIVAQEVVVEQASEIVAQEVVVEQASETTTQEVATKQASETTIEKVAIEQPSEATTKTDKVEQAKEEKQEPKANTIPKILLLGAMPLKGLSTVMFEQLIQSMEDEIAVSNQVVHISLVNFSKGYDQLAAGVKHLAQQNQWDWSKPIYVSPQAQNTYAKTISVLVSFADIVIRGGL